MQIGNKIFNLNSNIDLIILSVFVRMCSIILNRNVEIDELPDLYESNDACRLEMETIL